MKKLLVSALIAFGLMAGSAQADYTLIVPQEPGKGTSVWGEIIAKNLEKFIGEKVVVRHIPGARDIPGFNKFHNDLRFDDKTIMVAHGGNGVSYLLDKVDYNYFDYELIGSMNNDIVLGKQEGKDEKTGTWTIAGGSGFEPDAAAAAMLVCGPQADGGSIDSYLACWRERVIWVNGVSGGEKRLGFKNGEFDIARESPAAWKRFYTGIEGNELWFTHGILDLENNVQMDDPNFPDTQFEDVYAKLWGEAPSGDLYQAYKLTRNWRDAIQKSLWMNKGNPNAAKVKAAVTEMINDPVASAEIYAKTGVYPWIQDGPSLLAALKSLITEKALRDAVKWNREAYGFPSIYKPELLK